MDLSLVSVLVKCGVCVLVLLHSLYNLFNYLLGCLLYILKHVNKLKRTNACNSVSLNLLKDELKYFSKIPKHLAIIIEGEDISYHDCVKLILWCIHSDIPFISFYSYSSVINPTSLYEVLCKRSKTSLQNIKWGNSFHESVKEMAKKDINGYVWKPVVEVNLFSSKSVNESIENVILKFCQQSVKLDQISIAAVEHKFREEIPLPDPCFAFVFGRIFSTFGFMPWQIRVTEFTHLQTHHNLQVEDFLNALKSYSFCQQRFGK